MNKFFDLETIPDQHPEAFEKFLKLAQVTVDAPTGSTKTSLGAELNLTDSQVKAASLDELKKAWVEKMGPALIQMKADELWRKTSFDGAQGELATIAYAIDDGEVKKFIRGGASRTSERELLREYFSSLCHDLGRLDGNTTNPCLIGHNIEAFDLPFLFKRAVILQVEPPINLHPARYSKDIYDTMLKWAGYNGRISLENLCLALGLPSPKGDMDGSQVWDYVASGRIAEVGDYNASDVEAVRNCHARMTFRDCAEREIMGEFKTIEIAGIE